MMALETLEEMEEGAEGAGDLRSEENAANKWIQVLVARLLRQKA